MRQTVIDTSALLRLYIPDGPLPAGTESAVEGAWRGDVLLLAPDLLLVETLQVLRKKEASGLLRAEDVDRILEAVLELPLEIVGHRDGMVRALRLSRELSVSAYDALFLSLAVERGADLLSADERLVKAFRRATTS